jgi:hypothetical protein
MTDEAASGGHQCPYCASYDVERLYVASIRVDSCQCGGCHARWDEDSKTGEYQGRLRSTSVLTPIKP